MKLLKHHSFEKGFTLTEAIVVIAIFSLVIVVLLNLFDRHGALYSYEQAQLAVTGDSRLSMTELNTFASPAYRIVASRTVGGSTYTTGTTTVVLQLPAINSSGNVLPNIWDYVIFTLNGQELNEIIQPDAQSSRLAISRQIGETVSALVFTYDNEDLNLVRKINVDLTTSEQVRQRTVSVHVAQDIYLRNYF